MSAMQELAVEELWSLVRKDIAGIQIIWKAADCLYYQPQGEGCPNLLLPVLHAGCTE